MTVHIARHHAPVRRLAPWCGGLLLCVATLVPGAEVDRWASLFSAVPALPATPIEAAKMISARTVWSEGLGIQQLRIEIADPALRGLQQEVDRLYAPIVQESAAQMKRVMEAANKDPVLTELARKVDKTWQRDPANPTKLPSIGEAYELGREFERVLGPMPSPGSATPPPRTEIGAYRRELQGSTPRAAQFMQRLADQQRQHARLHAQTDREAIAALPGADSATAARALVSRHHALAQQQLTEAAAILKEARAVLAPRVQRLAELARAAEQRGAPAHERNEATVLIKAYVEFLLTLQRETVQDVGFWAAMRVAAALPTPAQAGTRSLYELSLAPGFELHANGQLVLSMPYYPLGRAIVVGLEPGIR